MVLDVILITIAIIVLLISSYTDIKTKEVPDWLNYGLIFAALGIRVIFSFSLGWEILVSGLLGFGIFFLLALFFYHTNQWGGGDSKLLMGMGAVIGIDLPLQSSSLNLCWFYLALLFLGSIYGLIWMSIVAFKKRHLFLMKIRKKLAKRKTIHYLTVLFLLIIILLGFLIHPLLFILLFPPLIYYLLIFVNAVESGCFLANVKVEHLTEGDWLEEDIFIDGKKVLSKKTLTKIDLDKLNQLRKNKKLDYVTIKEGIPFIPSFLFAYLLIVFGSGVFSWLLGKLF